MYDKHTSPAEPARTDQLRVVHWRMFPYEFLYNYVVYQ